MSLPIPDLDDKSFDDLLNEARMLIPVYNKEWTNHNPSDPGITLLELFAWLAEMTLFRLNRIPDEHYLQFLQLIGMEPSAEGDLESKIRTGLAALARQTRAITSRDYENLAMECMEELEAGLAGRAVCINNRDLEYSLKDKEKRGHVTVMILPNQSGSALYQSNGAPTDLLRQKVKAYLNSRRLITTRVHVTAPKYKDVAIGALISLQTNRNEKAVLEAADQETRAYFDPVTGGPDGTGWPLGRDVHRSELYGLLERMDGVDHVDRLLLNDEDVAFIALDENQLPKPTIQIEKKP
ncbi:MAG: hypothetical protein EHM45_09590 [Desulfobacteraceae bacterium]|nr:MAG: hypothetical protein EHM45_09590 [Desulfobacteraceae bacterium]